MPQVGSHPTFPIHKPQREKTRMNIQWSDNIPRLLLLSRQVANDWAKTEVDASCLLVAIIHKGDNAAALLITSDMYSKKFTPLSLHEHTREIGRAHV